MRVTSDCKQVRGANKVTSDDTLKFRRLTKRVKSVRLMYGVFHAREWGFLCCEFLWMRKVEEKECHEMSFFVVLLLQG